MEGLALKAFLGFMTHRRRCAAGKFIKSDREPSLSLLSFDTFRKAQGQLAISSSSTGHLMQGKQLGMLKRCSYLLLSDAKTMEENAYKVTWGKVFYADSSYSFNSSTSMSESDSDEDHPHHRPEHPGLQL